MAHAHAGGPDPFLTHGQYGADGRRGHGAWEPAAEPAFVHEMQGPTHFHEGSALKKPGNTGSFHTRSIASLVLVPWVCFVLVLFSTALPPPGASWRIFTINVYLATLAAGLICIATHFAGRIGPIYLFKGVLIFAGSTLALVIGNQIFGIEMANYWTNQRGVTYKNVEPKSAADAYQDANVLYFSRTSLVDLRNILGFRPQGTVTTYCVAPIIDRNPLKENQQRKEVNFWAAGEDCCEPLRSFLCGDVPDSKARTGLVFPPNASDFASARYLNFREAAIQAADLYGLDVPDRPIFVNWQEDALKLQNGSFTKTISELVMVSFMYLVASMLMAATLHWGSPRSGPGGLPMPAGGSGGGASGVFRTSLT